MKQQTIKPPRRIMILSAGSVAGKKEKQGPLGSLFDISGDDRFGNLPPIQCRRIFDDQSGVRTEIKSNASVRN